MCLHDLCRKVLIGLYSVIECYDEVLIQRDSECVAPFIYFCSVSNAMCVERAGEFKCEYTAS